MSHAYRAVGWNAQKRRYDAVIAGAVALYLAVFVGGGWILFPDSTAETLLIRGFGTCAFLLLHVVLSIGPLCRLNPLFLPLLYNRRHLGVTMCLLALAHGVFAIVQFHALGDTHPVVSVLTTSTRYGSTLAFPFQPLGLVALVILILMAATSHDFWLRALTPPVWKTLHLGVYVAYALLVLHVALGALQAERHPALLVLTAAGTLWIAGLHVAAARVGAGTDRDRAAEARDGWVDVCDVRDIPEKRARIVCLSGERVAVFKYDGRVSAVSNVCQHQNGPLGEGKIVGGCIVCPWHGYEYRPESGQSPPPFTEKVPTFRVAVRDQRVFVDPRPLPPGTPVPPAEIAGARVDGLRATDSTELNRGVMAAPDR